MAELLGDLLWFPGKRPHSPAAASKAVCDLTADAAGGTNDEKGL